MISRAIREGWQLPEEVLAELPEVVLAIVRDKGASKRERLQAAKLVMDMHAQNMELDGRPSQEQHLHLHNVDLASLSRRALEDDGLRTLARRGAAAVRSDAGSDGANGNGRHP